MHASALQGNEQKLLVNQKYPHRLVNHRVIFTKWENLLYLSQEVLNFRPELQKW